MPLSGLMNSIRGSVPAPTQQQGGSFLADIAGLLGLDQGGGGTSTIDDILGLIGGIRQERMAPPSIEDNPALMQLLQINQRKQQISSALTDETDPLRRRMQENELASLQNNASMMIAKMERAAARNRRTGRPTIFGGLDQRRRDEAIFKLMNSLTAQLPQLARSNTLAQLGAAAQSLGSGAGLTGAGQEISQILGDQRQREAETLGLVPQKKIAQGLENIFAKVLPQNKGQQQAQQVLTNPVLSNQPAPMQTGIGGIGSSQVPYGAVDPLTGMRLA